MTATIDGVAWTATSGVQTTFNNGILSFGGGDNVQTLAIAITANRGPGTYTTGQIDPLNVVVATLTNSSTQAGWLSGPTQGSGSVTLTTLTSTSASGTFTLTLARTPGTSATGNKVITNGSFNVTFTIPPTAPPGSGVITGTISATVDGAAWRGSVSARAATASGFLSLTGQDTDTRVITIAVRASMGTHSLNFGNPNNAITILGGQQWFTAFPGGQGSVVVTSLTSTRVTGTFTFTAIASQANTTLANAQVTNGQFDLAF